MKNIISTTTALLSIVLLMAYGCGSKTNKTKSSISDIDSVKIVLVSLQDSTEITWKTMIVEDDQKIAYLKRLIDEVSYTKVYDKKAYDSLSLAIENLKKIRYDQTSMANSEKIDEYDVATAAVVNNVITFAQNHPNFDDYPLMDELIGDILAFDNRVIYRRVDYDNIAGEYNKFIQKNHDLIERSGNVASAKPLFQLSE
ncbi:hypothetical protein QQ020_25325 [Fulvivirgaceae bacterium BMA12]|uniref:Lipoprotein n=1 Tax=Agaribacillus aureus TaxID=3051825 RepID=A0ABT8LEC7_9BACT|nr:hypothetical protein [Fulvivirgaceae bacterium BMA12]